jgi:four helix bundle protein
MHKVEDLKIWQKSIELTKAVYLLVAKLPEEEKFGLIAQLKRSAVSVASNIAEGAGRNSQKEFKHFLSVANGSAYELQTQLILLIELKLITKEIIKPIIDICIEIQKMNYRFQQKL